MELTEIINTLNFTSLTWQVVATLVFILFDVITGFISAIIQKNVDSQKMREGLLRKILLIIIILLSFIVQYGFGITAISKIVCIYIISMEVVSILENLQKAGIDLGRLSEILKIKTDDNTINLVVKKEEGSENEEK